MATNAEFIAKLRAAGVPEERIATYMAKKTGSDEVAKKLIANGVPPERVNDYLAKRATAQEGEADSAPLPLEANDTLGFLKGGNKVFNNILGAGSDALGAVGVPEDVRHAVGKVIRNPLGDLVPGHLLNKDETQQLIEQGAGVGQRPGKLGEAVGEIAATVPAAVASAGLAPEALAASGLRVSSPMAARALSAVAGKGFRGAAIQGGLQGLQTTENTDAGGIALDAAGGGLGGVAGEGINRGAAAFLAPRFGPAMNKLLDLGQKKFSLAALTGSTGLKKVEDSLRSFPGLGGFVEGSQNAMQRDFNRAYLQRAGDEADLAVPYIGKPTAETYGDLKKAFKDRYEGIDSRVNLTLDRDLHQAGQSGVAQTIREVAASGRRGDLAQAADNLFTPVFNPQTNQWTFGNLNGKQFQDIDGALRAQAKNLRNPGAGRSKSYGAIEAIKRIEDARAALKGAIGRQQPDLADKLERADKGYAMFKRAQEAVTAPGQGVDPEAFSAKALYDKTMNAQGGNARVDQGSSGDIPGQELASAALKVMGTKLGDSGTGMRVAVGKALSGGDLHGVAGLGIGGLGAGIAGLLQPAAIASAALYGGYAPGVRDVISNTVIGNSRNRFTAAARKAFDKRGVNNLLRSGVAPAAASMEGTVDTPDFRIKNGKRQKYNPETNQYEDQ